MLCLAANSSFSVIQNPPFRSIIMLSYMITIVKGFGYLSKSLGFFSVSYTHLTRELLSIPVQRSTKRKNEPEG